MSSITLIAILIEKLNQPTTVAVMASAGIHAALGLTLPHTTVFLGGEGQLPQPVQVISLSPEDRSRIPELAIQPEPPTIYQQSPLQSPFPPFDRLPTPNTNTTFPPIPAKPVFNRKPQNPPRQNNRNLNNKKNPTRITLQQPRRNTNLEKIIIQDRSRTNSSLFRGPGTIPIINNDPARPLPLPLNLNNPSPNPPPENNTVFQINREEIIALMQKQLGQETIASTAGENDNTDGQSLINLRAWLSRVSENKKIRPDQVIDISAQKYPQAGCAEKRNGSTVLGMEIDSNGNPTTNSIITKSSGYRFFDDRAIVDAVNYRFTNQTNQLQHYLVNVEFKYNEKNCQATNQNTPSPQPTGNTPGNSPATPSPQPTGNTPGNSPATPPSPTTGNTPGNSPATPPSPTTGNTPGNSPTTPPSPTTGNTPGNSPTTPPSPTTGNTPETPATPSPATNRDKREIPVFTTSPDSNQSKSVFPVPTIPETQMKKPEFSVPTISLPDNQKELSGF